MSQHIHAGKHVLSMNRDEEEISEKQKCLREYVKSTHANLRSQTKIYGAEEAWRRHVAETDVLQHYAKSMKNLASAWKANERKKGVQCRIEWIENHCKSYFFEGGKERFEGKEAIIKSKLEKRESDSGLIKTAKSNVPGDSRNNVSKVKLLDCGSCYNPFRDRDMFEVTAIDLAPACDSVFQCDFLNARVVDGELSAGKSSLIQLPAAFFDVVVFSLLLEYLPCPEQRFHCCEKARDLLKPGGLLVIVTPDSNHVGANAKFMKSWKFVLSKLGYMRIVYEKLPHIHCMAFRKCIHLQVAQRWSNLQKLSPDDELFASDHKIFIPQDFSLPVSLPREQREEKEEFRCEDIVAMFTELPCNNEHFVHS